MIISYYINTFTKFLAIAVIMASITACTVASGRSTASEYLDDTAVTARIKERIFDDPYLSTVEIQVETLRGVVQLSGFVDSPADKIKAGKIARTTKGVRSVQNSIIVR